MKTVLAIETTKPIGIHDLNGFLQGIALHMPGAFVSQGPSTRGRLTVSVLAPGPLPLEVAEQVLESLPHLCDSIAGLSLQEATPRRRPVPA
ncbi:hypothetical protein [Kineococcus glutinatus]|uniref:Uncharacterized protein n=1 Tax=Kineococcus glutinatus TaxID=1070872 RepID=A0ABP9I1I9_9ACTN